MHLIAPIWTLFLQLYFAAPTSSTNPDDEDIDIVGDDGNNNKNNISGNLSSSESSRDLQLHVYGPPQFTEADVLACMNELEEEDSKKSEHEGEAELAEHQAASTTHSPTEERTIKREVASPALSGSAGEDEEHHTEHNDHDDHSIKPKDSKIKIQDKSRCSKCLVSLAIDQKDPLKK